MTSLGLSNLSLYFYGRELDKYAGKKTRNFPPDSTSSKTPLTGDEVLEKMRKIRANRAEKIERQQGKYDPVGALDEYLPEGLQGKIELQSSSDFVVPQKPQVRFGERRFGNRHVDLTRTEPDVPPGGYRYRYNPNQPTPNTPAEKRRPKATTTTEAPELTYKRSESPTPLPERAYITTSPSDTLFNIREDPELKARHLKARQQAADLAEKTKAKGYAQAAEAIAAVQKATEEAASKKQIAEATEAARKLRLQNTDATLNRAAKGLAALITGAGAATALGVKHHLSSLQKAQALEAETAAKELATKAENAKVLKRLGVGGALGGILLAGALHHKANRTSRPENEF